MSRPEPVTDDTYVPRHPALMAGAAFLLVALSLCWPMFGGGFLVGDDQYIAGYAFRRFGAEFFRANGRIPEWNPYSFGGLPFIAASHGDIFYPTAWLRWFLPVDTAMNLGFAAHLVLAGITTYALLRALQVSWTGSVVGGLAYELTGILASLVRPGHDGKLFVSALAPLLFLALLQAVRHRRVMGYALISLTVGLCELTPHYQMTYYLLVGAALWTVYLVFFDPECPATGGRTVPLLGAIAAVALGVAIAALQILPFLSYIPYSPRSAGGPSTGWEYATAFAMPPAELVSTILPQFNGVLDRYWGSNFFKSHSEYLGVLPVVLATLGIADGRRRRTIVALGVIALILLLVAMGGHTPFYRAWYELMPMMKKVRAPGMAFFLVALPVAVFAGFGTDRLLRREVTAKGLVLPLGLLAGVALLGAMGALQPIAAALASPPQAARVAANAGVLQAGALRLLGVVALGAVVLWSVWDRRVAGPLAALALGGVVAGDLWSVDRLFFQFRQPAAELYRDDDITARLRSEAKPFRVLDVGVYQGSYLMAHDIQTVLGYHGNEVRFYDELLGGKGQWRNVGNPNLLDLLAVRFLLLPDTQDVSGYHPVLGPITTTPGPAGILYERDSASTYARVLPGAAKLPPEQVIPTVLDPRFPVGAIALYDDTASVAPAPIRGGQIPDASGLHATVTDWQPGSFRITLSGEASQDSYLVVAETWYPDWHAWVDGRPAPVLRADHALLSVVLPPGAREVRLHFASPAYAHGRIVTLLALLATAALFVGAVRQDRRERHA